MAHARTRLNSGLTGEVDQYVPQIWRIREMRRAQRRPQLAEETPPRSAPNSKKKKLLPVPPLCAGLLGFLRAHLLHPLAHGLYGTGRRFVHPLLKTLRGLFEVQKKKLLMKHLPRARDHGFDPLPYAEEFSGGLKEQLFVQQAVIQQRARLVPIPE